MYGYTLKDGTMLSLDYDYYLYSDENLESLFTRKLHDENGSLHILNQEQIIHEGCGIFQLWSQWRNYNTKSIFERTGGDAEYTLTNQRLVAYRITGPWGEASRSLTGISIPYTIAKYIQMKKHQKENIRQFLEIKLSDIIIIETYYSDLYFLSNYSPGKCTVPDELSEILIKYLSHRLKHIEEKGRGHTIYYYTGSSILKNEKIYDKRNALVEKALKFEVKGKQDKAIARYRKALELFPDDKFSKEKIAILSKRP